MPGKSNRLASALVTRRVWLARFSCGYHNHLEIHIFKYTSSGLYAFQNKKTKRWVSFTLEALVSNIERRTFFPAVIDKELVSAYTGIYDSSPPIKLIPDPTDPPGGAA